VGAARPVRVRQVNSSPGRGPPVPRYRDRALGRPFLFPVLSSSFGLRGTLLLTAGVSVLGMALTFVLPEPARRSLEDMPASPPGRGSPAAARGRPAIVSVRT
jgi:hypothetical protein